MNRKVSTLLLTVLLSMVGLQAFANYDTSTKIQVGDLYYYLDGANLQAQVIMPDGEYTGNIVIPPSIAYEAKTYSVTSIGDYAFESCSGLTSITIPNSVNEIGHDAFEGCNGLTSVNIFELESWLKIVFSDYSANPLFYAHHLILNGKEINDLIIPNSVTSIGKFTFYGYSGLTSITIPNSVTSIGDFAFSGCTGLTSAVIGNGVNTISTYAFSRCTGLTSITFGNSVETIGYCAVADCYSLTSIFIPKSVNNIDFYAFASSENLVSIVVDEDNAVYDSRNNCNAIIESATNTLIQGCKTTIIPNSVTCIGRSAFDGCSGLASIIIPESVLTIEIDAFYKCTNLTSITCYAKTPPSANGAFRSTDYTATLHVLPGCKEAYLQAYEWNKFNIVEDADTPVKTIKDLREAPRQRYYDLSGKELAAPTEGINIVVTEYEGGRTEVKKMTNSIYSEKTDRWQ